MIRAMVAELPRHSVRTPSYFTVRYRKRNAALKEYCFCETGGKRNIFLFDLISCFLFFLEINRNIFFKINQSFFKNLGSKKYGINNL